LAEDLLALMKYYGGIEHALAEFRLSGGDVSDHDAKGKPGSFSGQGLEFRLGASEEGGAFDKVAGRVTSEGELREEDNFGAAIGCLAGEGCYLGAVGGEVADGRVDLREGYAHSNRISCLMKVRCKY
jgi:hypothetical protein